MADIREVNGVFGGVELENLGSTIEEQANNIYNTVINGDIAEVQGTNNLQAQNVNGNNLPVKAGFWSKFKTFWLQEIDWKREIKIELTPHQQKIENEINEFLHQEITWEKVHDFLFQEVRFGRKKRD